MRHYDYCSQSMTIFVWIPSWIYRSFKSVLWKRRGGLCKEKPRCFSFFSFLFSMSELYSTPMHMWIAYVKESYACMYTYWNAYNTQLHIVFVFWMLHRSLPRVFELMHMTQSCTLMFESSLFTLISTSLSIHVYFTIIMWALNSNVHQQD